MPVHPRPAPLVSVIIPVFNGEQFLRRCIDSVLAQTEPDFELIVINDGSTDTTREILDEYEAFESRVRVIHQQNTGQGAARNRALAESTGEFILFVDADDFIERVTLQVTTERAIQDQSDLVHFDWKLYTPDAGRPGNYHYYNADPFWHKRTLIGPECDELLRVQNFYSVTKLYRRSFLALHDIRFEEGRIYEDNPFVLQAVNRAEIASLVHSPLYTIDPHPDSSTRSNTDTDKHVRDHLHAVQRTFELLDRRNSRGAAYLAAYHVKKIGPYYERRIPRKYKREYVREFVRILHDAKVTIPPNTSTNAPTRLAVRLKIFERNRGLLFQAMVIGKNSVMPKYKRARRWAKVRKQRNDSSGAWSQQLESALAQPILPRTISFLGLDFRYAGNSRVLFEEIINDSRFAGYQVRFVTNSDAVQDEYRLKPGLLDTNVALARSEILIAESWIPPRVRKHRDSTWVQLWHGTPMKRMLFDSHEPRIIWNRRQHKVNKYKDILNWDYLIADSPIAVERFQTSFLMDPQKIVQTGYPRVKYLLDVATEPVKIDRIRQSLGIPSHTQKKIILYAPTWRDYNYGKKLSESDFSYLLDLHELAGQLGEDYLILFHDHAYLSASIGRPHVQVIDATWADIQDLLVVSDVVITDYSSVMFDAIAIEKPVVLYASDLEAFEQSRGVYEEMWHEFSTVVSSDTAGVVEEIQTRIARQQKYPPAFAKKYSYNSEEELSGFILKLARRASKGGLSEEDVSAEGTGAPSVIPELYGPREV